jgi:choline dehydrogenase-like flavoprotein
MSDILIVGSGVGGATVARELAIQGQKVTLVERGIYHKVGTERRALGFYAGSSSFSKMLKNFSPCEKSFEGTGILSAFIVGGSSVVTFGNGIRALQKELEVLGIDLEEEFKEAERELDVAPLPENLMGERTKSLMKASKELGYNVKPMPKFIDFSKCRSCGNCVVGCLYGAKWTAQKFVGEAIKAGAKLVTGTQVDKVLHSGGEVKGVSVYGPTGVSTIKAENIVLAAGGVGTPIILQRSGLTNAGSNLFADLLVNTYGIIKRGEMKDEIGMATLIDDFHLQHGFMLSPILDTTLDMLLYLPVFKKARAFNRKKTLGLMTKVADDDAGKVHANGTISKPVTDSDRKKLDMGVQISKEILIQAGADPHSLYVTHVRAGHPGGTAGIGRIVNTDNETEINRLFVCDASVLPKAPGLPPVLTIVALAKRFSKKLVSEYL